MENLEHNQELIQSICRLMAVKDTPMYFPKPIIVKTTPHVEICRLYGIEISKGCEVRVMNPEQEWEVITPKQLHAGFILQTIFQRLKSLSMQSVAHNY